MNTAVKQYADKLRSAVAWRSNAREIMVSFGAGAWDEDSAARKYNVLMARWARPEALPGFGVMAAENNKVNSPVKHVPFIHASEASAPEPPKSAIQQHLEQIQEMVETNPVHRLPRYIERFNEKLAACSVEITDDAGNSQTIDGASSPSKLSRPSWLPRPALCVHEATANYRGKAVTLSMSVG